MTRRRRLTFSWVDICTFPPPPLSCAVVSPTSSHNALLLFWRNHCQRWRIGTLIIDQHVALLALSSAAIVESKEKRFSRCYDGEKDWEEEMSSYINIRWIDTKMAVRTRGTSLFLFQFYTPMTIDKIDQKSLFLLISSSDLPSLFFFPSPAAVQNSIMKLSRIVLDLYTKKRRVAVV